MVVDLNKEMHPDVIFFHEAWQSSHYFSNVSFSIMRKTSLRSSDIAVTETVRKTNGVLLLYKEY